MIDDILLTDSSSFLGSYFHPYTTDIRGSLEPPDLITSNSELNNPLGLGISPSNINLEEKAANISNNSIRLDSFYQFYSTNSSTTQLNDSSIDSLTGQVLEGSISSTSNNFPTTSDPNGTLATAENKGTFNDGTFALSDSLGYNGDQNDFFYFYVDNRTNLNLQLNGLSADANLRLIKDQNGNKQIDSNELIAASELGGTLADAVSHILEAGDYYVQVLSGVAGTQTNYNLEFKFVKLSGDIRNEGLARFGGVLVDDDDRYYPNGVNIYHYNSSGRTNIGIESTKDTIIVIHGWKSSSEAENIKELLKTSASQYPERQVLAIDW